KARKLAPRPGASAIRLYEYDKYRYAPLARSIPTYNLFMTQDPQGGPAPQPEPQPGGIRFGVTDFITGTQDRPRIRPHAVDQGATAARQLLAQDARAFRLEVNLPDATRVSMTWQRPTPTAGFIVWSWKEFIYAVSVLLGGLSD